MRLSTFAAGAIALMSMLWDPGPATGAQPLDGKAIFRFDTFGDEQLWTDVLRLHEAIATVSPATALAVGLKVDVEALPPAVVDALRAGLMSGPDPSAPLLHDPAEVGQDPRAAQRSATKLYRTTPLRALWQHPPYFHDGSAADLRAVVSHYDRLFGLKLTERQKADLVEYLKSI